MKRDSTPNPEFKRRRYAVTQRLLVLATGHPSGSVIAVTIRASVAVLAAAAALLAMMSWILPGITNWELVATLAVYALLIPPWILAVCALAGVWHGIYGLQRKRRRAIWYTIVFGIVLMAPAGVLLYQEGIRWVTVAYAAGVVMLAPLATLMLAVCWNRFPRI